MITQENIPYTADEIKAMVKTCEKYNKALEKARELMNKGYDVLMPEIFPELQENKDERIRKTIYGWIYTQPSEFFDGDFSKEEMLAWVEKQGENKPTDKIEPKFKLGDWIIFNGLILHIDEVVNGYYRTTSIGDGIHNSYDWDIDNAARLWSIKDAKDGDVLHLQHEGMEHVIIYKRLVKKVFHTILSVHCAYDGSTNDFFEDVDSYHCITSECDEKEIHPATKEQRDLLFRKMKEAGYEWDADKKELKKMEIKSKNFEPKTLDADKVIEWLKPYSVIEDNIINEFKNDFGL